MIVKTSSLRKEVSSKDGNLIILEEINLELEKGKSLAIVGPRRFGYSDFGRSIFKWKSFALNG